MINKIKNINIEMQLMDGVIIILLLSAIGTLNFNISNYSLLNTIIFLIFQIIFVFLLAIEIEEVYLNYKKIHFWILFLAIFFILIGLFQVLNIISLLLLSVMIYFLLNRFKKVIKRK